MRRWQRCGSWSTAAVLVFGLGFGLGRQSGSYQDDPRWLTASGRVGSEVFSVTHDGWTYGASDSIPRWIDARGSWHSGGWPDCLTQGVETVRFLAGPETQIEGVGERTVLAVDCRV